MAELCAWQCHNDCPMKLKCTKKCHEMCDREPCDQPCPKKIKKCNHPCIGLCGEPCPPICRICNPEELADLKIYKNETDTDARFLYLPDCGHCIEVEAMDRHMNMESEEIGMKKCPRCDTVIWSSVRYGNTIRQLYRDVAAVKQKALGDPKKYQDDFRKSFHNFKQLSASPFLESEFQALQASAKSKVGQIERFRNASYTPIIINEFELALFKNQKEVLRKLDAAVQGHSDAVRARLVRRAKMIADRVLSRTRGFNDWELKALAGEVARLQLFGLYWKLQVMASVFTRRFFRKEIAGAASRFPEAMEHIRKAEVHLLSLEIFTDAMVEEVRRELDAASRICGELGISKQERITILQAMHLGQGRWCKCPNGHIYAIGERGGAMLESKCNECGDKDRRN
ncbi:unnamed protein product [Darwinula stevensoni]|uniref:RZ-type domain-containing protein n=1 Tax=Darwinula stevensoni TaxID=69355 RepID=A0A7R8X543_9CRUS|nr:unnamed protein product [Darwinula stevensoni]CAG0880042.1 unnamed protein product [Darwinula stevensoni]